MTGIVTVTPAAAIDRTYAVGSLRLGEVNRAASVSAELSGKGVNVARAVALSGAPVRAVLSLGPDGLLLADAPGIRDLLAVVSTGGPTRVNVTLLDPLTGTTKVNENPIPLSDETWAAIVATADAEIERLGADWLVISGSVPNRAGVDALVDLTDLLRLARDRGVMVAVDTAGEALGIAVRNLDLVTLLKPNTHELAELTGRALDTIGDVVTAAVELHRAGCDIVYVSMGVDGALAVSASGVHLARASATVVNTAGAGDASLAGFLVGGTGRSGASGSHAVDVPTGLLLAASWGALAVSHPTTVLTSLEHAQEAVLVADPDPGTPLSEPARP